MLKNIDPKKRVDIILAHIAQQFIDARKELAAGAKGRMYSAIKCGFEMLDPLVRSLDVMEEDKDRQNIVDLIKKLNPN